MKLCYNCKHCYTCYNKQDGVIECVVCTVNTDSPEPRVEVISAIDDICEKFEERKKNRG